MRIRIHSPNIDLPELLVRRIEKKLQFTFKRLDRYIQHITINLSDVNGPKGGRDKSCRLQIQTDFGQDVVITGTYDSLYKAIESVSDRAKQALTKLIDKKKTHHRRQQQETKLTEAVMR